MSELELILKEVQEERRLRKVAEERARAIQEENRRRFGPLTVKEYVEECHALDGELDVVTEFTQVIGDPVVNPGDRS
ncbi:hypothetical protein E4U13_007339, partial [Claviceps humidiphila]